MRARVLIRPKEGILDPQGQAVERALPALGTMGVDFEERVDFLIHAGKATRAQEAAKAFYDKNPNFRTVSQQIERAKQAAGA